VCTLPGANAFPCRTHRGLQRILATNRVFCSKLTVSCPMKGLLPATNSWYVTMPAHSYKMRPSGCRARSANPVKTYRNVTLRAGR